MSAASLASTLRTQSLSAGHYVRALGATAPGPMTEAPAALEQLIKGEARHAWRWESGRGTATTRHYPMPPEAEPVIMTAFGTSQSEARRSAALSAIGSALARLHDLPAPRTGGTPALRRLETFLRAGHTNPGRDQFFGALRPGLAEDLLHDCHVTMQAPQGVMSHGWLGLDKWFVTDDGGIGVVGEDVGRAPREYDLGCLLAQCVEYRHLAPGSVSERSWRRDRSVLLDSYGEPVDDVWLDRQIRLAVARHVADYATHTRGPRSELSRFAHLINSLPPDATSDWHP